MIRLVRPPLLTAIAAAFVASACSPPSLAADLPRPQVDLPAAADAKPGTTETLVLAMGCFWCAEGVFERVQGVTDVTSGYSGGTADTANYELVSDHKTSHAEAIRVTYDPQKISYGKLLQIFFTVHDPTTRDRQGPDAGHQYRSAIFFANEEQRTVAAAYIKQLTETKLFSSPIVTTLEPLKGFYPAEGYHQDYVRHHPDNPYVRQWFPPKARKLEEHFRSLVKPEYLEK